MTKQKHLKARVRERMQRTGESYASARRQVLAKAPEEHNHQTPYLHLPGNIPAATCLRILLANSDAAANKSRKPLSEAMVMGVAGGIGAGVFTFRYEAENISSFYIDGRHLWWDDLLYFEGALDRVGLQSEVRETGGVNKARSNLEEMLAEGKPVVAWVDQGSLPYRVMPSQWEGGGYHVLVVYRIEGERVVIGDLAQKPIELDLSDLADARARIKKQKNRLLALQTEGQKIDLEPAVIAGVRACLDVLRSPERKNFSLQAFEAWSNDLTSQGKDGWKAKFPDGRNLWRGLTSIYDYIEHYGTGGGLCRPIFADFLQEAADELGLDSLLEPAAAYQELGAAWSQLARSALPAEVPKFEQARQLLDEKAERFLVDGASGRQAYADIWQSLEKLEDQAQGDFPLTEAETDDLLASLSQQVGELYLAENEALEYLERSAVEF